MHNRLSFMNSFFVLLFIGKIGHIGTLGGIPWVFLFIPLVLDLVLDFLTFSGITETLVARLRVKIKIWELKKLLNSQSKKGL